MKTITEYFRSALNASTKMSIEFKDNEFETIFYEDIENGQLDFDSIKFLWKNNRENAEEEKEKNVKSVILAVKNIATEFTEYTEKTNTLEEMTCIFFVPATVDVNGRLYRPMEGKWPWIPREFLESMEDAQLTVGDIDKLDRYLEKTTDIRNKIESWKDYYDYAKKMYEAVTGEEYSSYQVKGKPSEMKTDGKCYIFADDTVNSVGAILQLYNFIMQSKENLLYKKMTGGELEQSKILPGKTDKVRMQEHVGQMSGEYPLQDSQREVVHCLPVLSEGEVIAVSGPPGTGKTTLLQSVVANEYVMRALRREKAPIIVAASTNNQAVINIIDSFSKIHQVGIGNLEVRWVNKVHSFATYFPSVAKMKEAQEKGYQYTDIRGSGFIEEVEEDNNRVESKKKFLEEFKEFYEIESFDLRSCSEVIHTKLKKLDMDRRECLGNVAEVSKYLGGKKYKEYRKDIEAEIKEVNVQISSNEQKLLETKEEIRLLIDRKIEWRDLYNQLPWYMRMLKFLPCIKKRLEDWSYENVQNEELAFLKRGMNISQIQEAYKKQIDAKDDAIQALERVNQNYNTELLRLKEQCRKINKMIELTVKKLREFVAYRIYESETELRVLIDEFNINEINSKLDRVRYVQFWMAVHYYECEWLIQERGLSEKQIGTSFENVIDKLHTRLAMLSPCMVMTFHHLPKQFCAYISNEKKNIYMSNYIDLLVVDEAGQTSPEIALPAFFLAKKAVVVGDEQQIPPVWGVKRAVDIALAKKSGVIRSTEEYERLVENGLNCSESSIMKVAGLSCAFNAKDRRGFLLREHWRCFDEIIAYCNRLVYDNGLEPKRGSGMKNRENPLLDKLPAMGYKNIPSENSVTKGGSRYNKVEAEKIAEWVRDNFESLLACYPKLEQKMVLGIVTPFKVQAIRIRRELQKYVPEYWKDITVGTVHTFQGAERQVIIFSSVYGKRENCFFINRNASLMNVAVSRAKDSFLMFGDRECLHGGEHSAAGLLKMMLTEEVRTLI